MQRLEAFEGEAKKRFMLHYNFPPFSVGEVAFLRGAGRREIGHGALAERAISAVLPSEEKWPYAMRVVSDILESNGSSSMATVCGAALSLMDAGVPLKRLGRPEEIAETILFVASDKASFISGASIPVNGGKAAL